MRASWFVVRTHSRGEEKAARQVKLQPRSFARGQVVRLLDRPLADVNGLFEETREEDGVVLLVSLLGRKVRMPVSAAVVVAA